MSIEIFAVRLVLAILVVIGLGLFVRWLGRRPFYWTFTPANTFCLVVTNKDERGDGMTGGNLVDLLHGVTEMSIKKHGYYKVGKVRKGKKDVVETLVEPRLGPMDWEFVPREDPVHDRLLYRKLGVQSMNNIFHTTRINIDRRTRFSREEKEGGEKEEMRLVSQEALHSVTKINRTRHVFYSGELTATIKEAGTKDRLALDFDIDFSFRRRFPVRSILRVADPVAFLESLVRKIVNDMTVNYNALDFFSGDGEKSAEEIRNELVHRIEEDYEFHYRVLNEIGFEIQTVSLRRVTMSQKHRELLELQIEAKLKGDAQIKKAELEAQAVIVAAEGEKVAGYKANDVAEDYVKRVIIPTAKDPRTTSVRWADAYEKNSTLRTLVTGKGGILPTLPLTEEEETVESEER